MSNIKPPRFTLNYVPIAGRAEIACLIFAFAEAGFTDNQLREEEWEKVREDDKKFPLNKLPTLEVEGQVICHSHAIYRYLANEFDLYGTTNMEKAIVDQVYETLFEIIGELRAIRFSKDPDEKKLQMYKEVLSGETTKKRYRFICSIVEKSNGDYILGEKIMFPDILLFANSELWSKVYPNLLDDFPKLKTLCDRVGEVESVKKHIKSTHLRQRCLFFY